MTRQPRPPRKSEAQPYYVNVPRYDWIPDRSKEHYVAGISFTNLALACYCNAVMTADSAEALEEAWSRHLPPLNPWLPGAAVNLDRLRARYAMKAF